MSAKVTEERLEVTPRRQNKIQKNNKRTKGVRAIADYNPLAISEKSDKYNSSKESAKS